MTLAFVTNRQAPRTAILAAFSLISILFIPRYVDAQESEGTARLSRQLEQGEISGQFVERTPGNYVLVPETPDLPVQRVLNPDQISSVSVGSRLVIKGSYDEDGKGVLINEYELPTTLDASSTRGLETLSTASSNSVDRALTAFREKIDQALKPGAMSAEVLNPEDNSNVTLAAREVERDLSNAYRDAVNRGESGMADRNAALRGLATVRQELKSIYGTYDNYPPWSYERISDNALSVVAIAEPGQTRQALCSGVLISSDLVLTAGHCFRNQHPKDLEVWFGFSETADQTPLVPVAMEITELVAPAPELHDEFLLRASEDRFDAEMPDFAIVRIKTDGNEAVPTTAAPQCLRKRHIGRGRALYVIGYPKGTRETVHDNSRVYLPFRLRPRQFEELKQDIEVDFVLLEESERLRLMSEFVASYVQSGDGADTVFELFDTRWGSQPKIGIVADLFRGNSGSPVFDRDNHCIVGIHTGGASDTGLRLGATWQTHETVLPIPAIIAHLENHPQTLRLVESGVFDLR